MKTLNTFVFVFATYVCAAQCYVYDYCTQANFNSGANCHGFSYRYLQKGYSLPGIGCGTPSAANRDTIYDCITKHGYMEFTSFSGYIENATQADHTLLLYKNPSGGVTHSAVKLSSNSYISKWESNGPLVVHGTYDVPAAYYSTGYTVSYHKLKSQYYLPSDPAVSIWPVSPIYLSACTSCSCRTSQGYFLVSASMSPSTTWTPVTWSVSGASIAATGNNYIYVNKPGGGSVGVTANTTYTYKQYCTKPYSKFQMFLFPSCSGGGFRYAMDNEDLTIDFERDQRSVSLVLPETLTNYIRDKKEGNELEKNINVKVYDLQGTIYRDVNVSAGEPYFELFAPLKKGIYIFKVTLDAENTMTEKIAID